MSYTNCELCFRNSNGDRRTIKNFPTSEGIVFSRGGGDFTSIPAGDIYDEIVTARGETTQLRKFVRYETVFENSSGVAETYGEFFSGTDYRAWVAVSKIVRKSSSYGYPVLDHLVGYQQICFTARHIPGTDEKYNTHTMIPVNIGYVEYDANIGNRVSKYELWPCALYISMEYDRITLQRVSDGGFLSGIYKLEKAVTGI